MLRLSAVTLTVAAIVLGGCGGSSSSPSSTTAATSSATPTTSSPSGAGGASSSTGTSGSLALAANPEGQLAYNTKSLTASAGKVSIAFTNNSPLSHNVTIESSAGKIEGATPTFQGASKTLTLNLKPGTYKFFCSVPGHRMAGMEGTLTVK